MCEVISIFRDKDAKRQQNASIQANTFKALQAAERLVKEGFTITKVKVDQRKPIIWIQYGPECKRLPGHCYNREHKASGTVYTFEAAYASAFIKWTTTEPSPLGVA